MCKCTRISTCISHTQSKRKIWSQFTHDLRYVKNDRVCVSQGWVEVDGVMSKALRGFITFPTATLEGFPHADLCPVPIFGVVLYTVHILVSLLASWNGAREGLLITSIHAHGAEDWFGADGTFCGPGFITVRVFILHLLFITLAACGCTAAEGRWWSDGRGHGRG